MEKIKYSKSISILVFLILIVFLFTGCNLLKAVLPNTNQGTTTTNNESTTGSNEESATSSNSGSNSNTGASTPSNSGGITEYLEQEVLVRIKPGADIDKIVSEVGGTIIETLPQISVIRIKLAPKVSIAEAIKTLEKFKEVEYAEPNGICYMDLIPNDSDYGSQWAPQLTGAESAWGVTTGSVDVIIAITDTGVDGTHPDFGGKVIAGYDTYHDSPISAGANSSVHPHGTHCAGIAAAIGNNSQGIAGIAWNCPIMPIKICDDGPYYGANDFDMAEAFMWAADNGAAIISCSFGGKGYSQTMKDAIDYAVIDNGCVMVASMGNSHRDEIMYPAGYQSVIAVGATDAHDEIASFSTTGNHMSVCAPGVEIYSTIPGDAYDYYSGTSMSCPFVAGAAALILSQNSGMSPEGVKTQLEKTAFDLGSDGFDPIFGHGRVDLAAAVGAPQINDYGGVDVWVTNESSNSLSGASVILWQGGAVISTTNSNTDGAAKFDYIPAGDYGISVSLPGYISSLTADNLVTVVAGEVVPIHIVLTPLPRVLFDDVHNPINGYTSISNHFAPLISYLEDAKYIVDIGNMSNLEDYDILVLADPHISFNTSEITSIQTFLQRGGKLVMLGEHGYFSDNSALNALSIALGIGITLNQDVVCDDTDNYQDTNYWPLISDFVSHAVTTDISTVIIGCGSSLNVTSPATVVAWSDQDSYNEQGAENIEYSPLSKPMVLRGSKSQGLFIMIAVSEVNDGKVFVVGDTNLWSYDMDIDFFSLYDNEKLVSRHISYVG